MIKNFTNKFGKDALVVMGDYDKGGHNMAGLEPTICKRFRKLFTDADFCVYLVNEFKTSKLCNCCHHELAPFLIRESHKPKDIAKNKLITVNGLLSHKEDTQTCKIIHNRVRYLKFANLTFFFLKASWILYISASFFDRTTFIRFCMLPSA